MLKNITFKVRTRIVVPCNSVRDRSRYFRERHERMASVLNWVNKQVANAREVVQKALPQEEIPFGNRRVRIIKQLGEGGYAFVYLVEDVNTGRQYAMKRMLAADKEAKQIAMMEVKMMKSFKGAANLVKYYDSRMKKSQRKITEFYILMEHCKRGALLDEIQERIEREPMRHYRERDILRMFRQTCTAIKWFHTQKPPVQHRDLKIENLLLTTDGTIKLCDFGSCTIRSKSYTTRSEILQEEERIQKYTTNCYMAPEMADLYKHEVISEKVDIWALGCILYVLAFFEHPFQDKGNLAIMNGTYEIPKKHKYSELLVDTIKGILVRKPKKRPNIHRVLKMVDEWEEFLTTGKRRKKVDDSESDSEEERKKQRKLEKKKKKLEKKKKKHKEKVEKKRKKVEKKNDDFDVDWSQGGAKTDEAEFDVDWNQAGNSNGHTEQKASKPSAKLSWDPFAEAPSRGADVFGNVEGNSKPKPTIIRAPSGDISSGMASDPFSSATVPRALSGTAPKRANVPRAPSIDPFAPAQLTSDNSDPFSKLQAAAAAAQSKQGFGMQSHANSPGFNNNYGSPGWGSPVYNPYQQQQSMYGQQQHYQQQQYQQYQQQQAADAFAGMSLQNKSSRGVSSGFDDNPFTVGFATQTSKVSSQCECISVI
ncbi:hypothetical protein AAMO2058_000523400 [Amorphochlora amoebiformis]